MRDADPFPIPVERSLDNPGSVRTIGKSRDKS
jgi:hypothetical protein